MQATALDKSFDEFIFQIYYLDYHTDMEEIGDPNIEDILYVKCYPKWDMREAKLKNIIEENKSFLLRQMKEIVRANDLFYCYFEIDFTDIYGTTTNIVSQKVRWIEARPKIKKRKIDSSPTGFINAGDLPPEN